MHIYTTFKARISKGQSFWTLRITADKFHISHSVLWVAAISKCDRPMPGKVFLQPHIPDILLLPNLSVSNHQQHKKTEVALPYRCDRSDIRSSIFIALLLLRGETNTCSLTTDCLYSDRKVIFTDRC